MGWGELSCTQTQLISLRIRIKLNKIGIVYNLIPERFLAATKWAASKICLDIYRLIQWGFFIKKYFASY